MLFRVFLNSEVRGVFWSVVKFDDTLELQVIARTLKFYVGDAIPEDIMKPSHLRWLGCYIEREIYQPLVKTVSRAYHHLMPAEPYFALVPICCIMPDDEDRHDSRYSSRQET